MGLEIVVCMKAVITKVPVKGYVRTADALDLNPFDRPVLETALRLREAHGGRVRALTMGPDASLSALYEAYAMGVDEMVLLSDPALAGSDTLATAKALSAALKKLMPFDLLLFGTRSADSDTGQVGPQTAVLLGLPLVTSVHAIEWTGGALQVERRADGFLEGFECPLPGVLTVSPGAVEPRDAGLSRLETVFQKGGEERWGLSDLGLSAQAVGWTGSATKVPAVKRVVKERHCEFLVGSTEEQIEGLMDCIRRSGVLD